MPRWVDDRPYSLLYQINKTRPISQARLN